MKFLLSAFLIALINIHAFYLEATDPLTNDHESIVKAAVEKFMRDNNVPGMAVGLYYKDQPYFYNFGSRNKALSLPVTSDTIFKIASVTKCFAAITLALEIENGRVTLDDPIKNFLPFVVEHPGPYSYITLGQLATHTSSLPKYTPMVSMDEISITREETLNGLLGWNPPYPIGSRFNYSNWGYRLLDFCLENLNGETGYMPLFKSRIQDPLGMHNTFLEVPRDLANLYAQGYRANGSTPATNWPEDGIRPGSGLRSCTQDMMKFLMAHLGRLGPVKLSNAIQYAQKGLFEFNFNRIQALAWVQHIEPATTILQKDGSCDGFRSYIGFVGNYLGIILLVNMNVEDVPALGKSILVELHSHYKMEMRDQ